MAGASNQYTDAAENPCRVNTSRSEFDGFKAVTRNLAQQPGEVRFPLRHLRATKIQTLREYSAKGRGVCE
jgi:hypothetical protein